MNWEVILWTCLTVGVLLAIAAIVIWFISGRTVRKRQKELGDVHTTLKVGSRVMFAGGLYGKVVKISKDTVDIEISKGVVVSASRYGIQSIEK